MRPDHEFVAFLLRWHGLPRRRAGPEDLRRTLRQLQGISVPVSELESSILPARIRDYSPLDLDELIKTGEIVWQGNEALGRHDGCISLFLKDDFPRLGRINVFADGNRERCIRDLLLESGGLEFGEIVEKTDGFPDDVSRALWKLVWCGEASSDSLDALRPDFPRPPPATTGGVRMPDTPAANASPPVRRDAGQY
jgi:ATP-dependent helicase Lhr and Lhr-like helicase